MSEKKLEKQARQNIIIDMNDFLITYAKSILGPKPDLAQKVYEAGKNDVDGLDKLFNDAGYGRKQKYEAIAQGFICDFYHIDPAKAKVDADKLAHEAMHYLGKHTEKFNRWAEA
ncbi:hypothetical protein ACQW5G_02340 [Fructilactobacillus sp. Tb1]|uniref:hypothetical protein n=1 Tax=Fructilactobacillus sp. Tb1 TaxID=3422304 RepID=UPI003D2E468A